MESKSSSRRNNIYFKIAISVAIVLFFIYVIHFLEKKPNSTEIQAGSNTIYAQVADTNNKRSLGLSYTESIDQNAGMLFVFDEIGEKNFWMRDMLFDIDIIWLDENKQVIGFFENVSKDSYLKENQAMSKIYHSPDLTKYVLEVNAGIISKLKIKVGDILDFKY